MPDEDQAPARTPAPSPAGPRLSRRAFLGAARRRRRGHRPRGSRWLRLRGRHRRVAPFGDANLRLPWPAPGRHRHAGPGPHVHGGVRPDHDLAGRASRDAPPLDDHVGSPDARPPRGPDGLDIRSVRRAARGHRRGDGPAGGGTHHHPRLRPVAVRRHAREAGRPVRPGGSSSGRAHRAPAFPRRRHRSCAFGRGHRRPGLRRRPAGRCPCHPEPDPLGVRHGAGPLVAARVRSDVIDLPGAADPAEPVRLQGWDREHHGRGDGASSIGTSGCKAPTIRPPAGWRVARTWSPGASG